MIEYNKINIKLSNLQLSKLKNAVKKNEGTTLRKFLIQIIYLMHCF